MATLETGFPLSSQTLAPHPGRRRDKPQLSCHLCRRRKKKCDRQHPCSTCLKLEIGHDCSYSKSSATEKSQGRQRGYLPLRNLPVASKPGARDGRSVERLVSSDVVDSQGGSLLAASTNLRIDKFGNDYKDGSHWTSVLSRATSSGDRDFELDDAQMQGAQLPIYQTVLLFDCARQASEKELIAGLPPRNTCDELISSYFRLLDHCCFLHAREFLTHYYKFWENPEAAPTSWLGLLYSTICIAAQFQSPCPHDCIHEGTPHTCGQEALLGYREKTVQCLIIAQYGRGGPFIMETLLHYFTIENYLRRDSNTGLWLLLGTIVQIAIRMGYHRDPRHFKSLSAYDGEMRRRMWAHIYIFDTVLATQLGLPAIIKESICDTLPPRNISDDDYDSTARSLPPPRPDEEITQSSVAIAKFWLATALAEVSNALSSLHPYSLADAMRIDDRLNNALKKLPKSIQHRPLSESILDSRITVFQRVNVKLTYLRGRILLHWKFVAASKEMDQYEISRNIVVDSAVESLELQHLTINELRPYRRLTPISLYDSAIVNHTHLLATSVLCFYIRYFKNAIEGEKLDKIQTLLEGTRAIWHRSSNRSVEARRAADALSTILKRLEETTCAPDPEQVSQVDRDPFNWPQLPFTYCNAGFDNLAQLSLGDGAAFLYPPSISPMDLWATSNLPGGCDSMAFNAR